MQASVGKCPMGHSAAEDHAAVPTPSAPHYTMTGGPKGVPLLGMLIPMKRNPLKVMMRNALEYGDIIPFRLAGMKTIQLNHPDLIQYVLVDNYKNYNKSDMYIRFEPVGGKGLFTSNGEQWRRDRQKIQPMFKKEQIEGYYFDVVNEVSEKFKQRWLALTKNGPAEIDVTHEMASITIEVIVKTIFGKDNFSKEIVESLHYAYHLFMDYVKDVRMIPQVDFRKVFHTPRYMRFKQQLDYVEGKLKTLVEQYRRGEVHDKYNMLALLIEAQKQDPEHFTEQSIRDHSMSMVFAGFETTSIVMQWMWYVLDTRPDVADTLRSDMINHAPYLLTDDSRQFTYDALNKIHTLSAVFKETMRLYPPIWAASRTPVEDDYFGDYKVERGTIVMLTQMTMHRHPRFWEEPNAFIYERFMPENEGKIHPGLYFPFSQGPRKCSGIKFSEMEAKTVFAKLLPLFKVTVLNGVCNEFDPSVSLRLKEPLRVKIERL